MLPGQTADGLAGLLIGPGSDGASIHHHQVRSLARGRGAPPPERQFPGHPGGVALVHLTAESDDAEKAVLGFGFWVLGYRVPVFGWHFQGLRLKESKYLIFTDS
jgi:hypothetical protein